MFIKVKINYANKYGNVIDWKLFEADSYLDYRVVNESIYNEPKSEYETHRFNCQPSYKDDEEHSSDVLYIGFTTKYNEAKNLIIENFEGNIFILNDKGQTIERL